MKPDRNREGIKCPIYKSWDEMPVTFNALKEPFDALVKCDGEMHSFKVSGYDVQGACPHFKYEKLVDRIRKSVQYQTMKGEFCTFDNFYPGESRVIILGNELTGDNFREPLTQHMGDKTYIFGEHGAGKTHLAVALLLELWEQNQNARIRAIQVPGPGNLFAMAWENFYQWAGTPTPEYSDLIDSDFLLIDDLAAEKDEGDNRKRQAFQDLLYDIVRNYKGKLIITSNKSIRQLTDGKIYDARITSVLKRDCVEVYVERR